MIVQPRFPQERYTEQVLAELRGRARAFAGWTLGSIYFGGGTPSMWEPRHVARVAQQAVELFDCEAALEVTLEANPGDVDEPRLQAWREAGINRLSLGVQSLDDSVLRRLTRGHDAATVRRSFEAARSVGFSNISCDLMFGLAGQSAEHHLRQLAGVLALGPDHLSLYELTLARGCALRRAGEDTVDDDLAAGMLESGRELIEAHGLPQYEVSNYARPGRRSRHNGDIWRGRPYLGLGAAAHSMIVDGAQALRCINPPASRYLDRGVVARDGQPVVEGARTERVSGRRARGELMMLGLRTATGVDRAAYAARFGVDPAEDHARGLRAPREQGLIALDERSIRPTRRGIWFADELALRLL